VVDEGLEASRYRVGVRVRHSEDERRHEKRQDDR
jgi:hypothetical protein